MRPLAFLAALAASTLWAADPQLVNLVPPDTKMLAGINVEQAKTSQFGQYVLRQFVKEEDRLGQFIEATGFDPRRDIREILVASSGGPKSTMVLMKGRLDADRLNQALTRLGGSEQQYKDLKIVVSRRGTEALAVLDAETLVAGPVESVKGAIERRLIAAILEPSLAVRVNHWSTSQDAWFVSDYLPPMDKAPAEAFRKIQQANGGIKFGQVVTVRGEAVAETSGDAKALADVIRLLANMAMLQSGQRQNQDTAELLRSLTVTAEERTVNVSVTIPEEQLERMLVQAQSRPTRSPAERLRRSPRHLPGPQPVR